MDIAKPMKLDEISAVVMIDFLGVPRLICFCGAVSGFQVICQRDLHVCQHATTVEDGNFGRVLDAGLSDQQPGILAPLAGVMNLNSPLAQLLDMVMKQHSR